VQYFDVARPPVLQNLIDIWTEYPHGIVIFKYDTSGSMNLNSIQPTFGEFKIWLEEQGILVFDYGGIGIDNDAVYEQWLGDAYYTVLKFLEEEMGS
jgi:hypothetical protein